MMTTSKERKSHDGTSVSKRVIYIASRSHKTNKSNYFLLLNFDTKRTLSLHTAFLIEAPCDLISYINIFYMLLEFFCVQFHMVFARATKFFTNYLAVLLLSVPSNNFCKFLHIFLLIYFLLSALFASLEQRYFISVCHTIITRTGTVFGFACLNC